MTSLIFFQQMIVGIIKEGKNPPDKRVPFTPEQCVQIQKNFKNVEVVVQKSKIRAIADSSYEAMGIKTLENVQHADVLFGVKEVNIEDLIPNKKYFFFSHTIKKQPYNRELLQSIIKKNIQLIDYECIRNQKGIRLVGFGRYAGIVGSYNGFRAYGIAQNTFSLKAAHLCTDRNEMEAQLPKVMLPKGFKIVITGLGRVASGAEEILNILNVKKVEPNNFLCKTYNQAVYTQLTVEEYFKRTDGQAFDRFDVYKDPTHFERNFMPYAQVADMFISCHFWDSRGPKIFTKEDAAEVKFNIRTVADISCDIDDPIASTLRPSTIVDPIYYYDRFTGKEVNAPNANTITVMAVDNLPCELPKDASEDFGNELLAKVLPSLLTSDHENIIENASITKAGRLGDNYMYLSDYLKEN